MKARGPGSGWFPQNYDKLTLVVMLLALIVSAALLVTKVGGVRKSLADGKSGAYTGPRKEATPTDLSAFETNMAALSTPFQIPPEAQRMSVGGLRVRCVKCGKPIPFKALVCPFDGAEQPPIKEDTLDSDGDGIPDLDEKALGLNPADPADGKADLDQDGFSNLDEYQAHTDLKDPAKHPTSIYKMRLVRAVVEPFRFRFQGMSKTPSGDRFQLNVRTLDRTYFSKLGDVVEGFTLSSVETNASVPALVLTRGTRTIRLVQGRVINEDDLSAQLTFLIDGSVQTVRIGSMVKMAEKSYKVVDIKRDRVVVRDEEAGEDIRISPMSEEERLQLQGGSMQAPR